MARPMNGIARAAAAFLLLLASVSVATAAETDTSQTPSTTKSSPKVLKPTRGMMLPSQPYTARTRGPAGRQGNVTAGGARWRCSASQCTTTAAWPMPTVEGCRALAAQVGEITSYGHTRKQLGAAELRECNRGLATAAGRLPLPGVVGQIGPEVPQAQSPIGGRLPESAKPTRMPTPTQRPSAHDEGGAQASEAAGRASRVAAARVQPPKPDALERSRAYVKRQHLEPPEIEHVASELSHRGIQHYRFASAEGGSSRAAAGTVDLGHGQSRDGLLIMRDRSRLEKIGEDLYTDEGGAVYEFGELAGAKGRRGSYSITYFAPGSSLRTVDGDGDGVVDLVVSVRKEDGPARYGVLANELGRRLWDCWGYERSRPDPSVGGESAAGGDPCAPFRHQPSASSSGSRGGGPGSGPGVSPWLEEPDCAPRMGPPDDPDTEEAEHWIDRRDQHWRQSQADEQAAAENEAAGGPRETTEMLRELSAREGKLAEIANDVAVARMRFVDRMHEVSDEELLDMGTDVMRAEGRYRAAGGSFMPSAGSDPAFDDPRCLGREQASDQGRLFTDPGFCKGLDMLTCLVKQQDATLTATGKRCRNGPSPAGGMQLQCERRERDDGSDARDPDCVLGGQPGCGADDRPGGRLGGHTRQSIPLGYVDMTPLGPFIANLCAQGGCPEGF